MPPRQNPRLKACCTQRNRVDCSQEEQQMLIGRKSKTYVSDGVDETLDDSLYLGLHLDNSVAKLFSF
jgi:hypothetical protein